MDVGGLRNESMYVYCNSAEASILFCEGYLRRGNNPLLRQGGRMPGNEKVLGDASFFQ